MSKALEALERIENQFNQLGIRLNESGWHIREDDYFIIEKELKALEIIKKKQVDTLWLIDSDNKSLDDYNEMMLDSMGAKRCKELTQEEYDLLMEVLA